MRKSEHLKKRMEYVACLQRYSSERLAQMLYEYLESDRYKACPDYVLAISQVLEQRYMQERQEPSEEILRLWNKYLEKCTADGL